LQSFVRRNRTTVYEAAERAARKAAITELPVQNVIQLQALANAVSKIFGWGGNSQPSVTYYGDDNRTLVVCDEARRRELIAQRERLLPSEASSEHKIEAAAPVPVTLPVQETQSDASASVGNGIVAQDQSPVTPQDPVFQRWESIGKAESWKIGTSRLRKFSSRSHLVVHRHRVFEALDIAVFRTRNHRQIMLRRNFKIARSLPLDLSR